MIGYNLIASPGQLANQMFKYAALKGISKNMGYSFCIPPSYPFIENNKLVYKVATKYFIKNNKQNHQLFKGFQMQTLTKGNIKFLNSTEVIKERSFEFDKNIFNKCPDNVNIWGFFQSEKYFTNVRDDLKNDFKFKNKYFKKARNIIDKFDNPTSIHVRRADYITNENHSPLSLNYYEDAVSSFSKDQTFLIFTDDTEWVKKQKIFQQKNFYILSDILKNKFLDLCSMTLCNNHIIANSSFSWWGAWLSSQEQIIAPNNWFKNSKSQQLNTKDLIPSSWIKIDN